MTKEKPREPYSVSKWEFKPSSPYLPMVKPSSELVIYENKCMMCPRQVKPKGPTIYAPTKRIVDDVLSTEETLCLSGPMNANKAMHLLSLAVAAATGGEWLNHPCQERKVLYINAGMSKVSLLRRLEDVAKAMKIKGPLMNLSIWHIMPRPIGDYIHMEELEEMLEGEQFDVIIIDPIHHFRLPTEESVERCCHALLELAVHHHAAVVYSRHSEVAFDCDIDLELEADVVMSLSKCIPERVVTYYEGYRREGVIDEVRDSNEPKPENLWSIDYEFYSVDPFVVDEYGLNDDVTRQYIAFDYPIGNVL